MLFIAAHSNYGSDSSRLKGNVLIMSDPKTRPRSEYQISGAKKPHLTELDVTKKNHNIKQYSTLLFR